MAIYYLHYHHSSYFYLVGFLPAPHLLKVINLKYRGFLAFPDVPSRHKPRLLTETDFKLAKSRLEGLTAQLKIPKTIFKRVWGNWHWHFFVAQWCLLDQNSMIAGQPFSLYLKAKSKIYSIRQINTLPTIATAISIVCPLSRPFRGQEWKILASGCSSDCTYTYR